MAYLPTRARVLSLYRRIMHLSNKWQSKTGLAEDTNRERRYIRDEAQTLFRKNKDVTDSKAIEQLHIREAEARLEIAEHYRIPYPRMPNIPQRILPPSTKGGIMKKRTEKALRDSIPSYMRSFETDKTKKGA